MPENLLELWEKATPAENLTALWDRAKPIKPIGAVDAGIEKPSEPKESFVKGIGKAAIQGATAFPKAFWGVGATLEDLAYKGFGGKDEYKDLATGGFAGKQYKKVKDIEERFQPQQEGVKRYITDAVRTMAQMASSFAGTGGMGTLPAMATGAGIEKYLGTRKEGYSIPRATSAGVTTGATEYLTELTPIKILNKPGLSFLKRLAGGLIADVPGELVATISEMKAVDEGILGKSYTPEQYTRALIDTAITSGLVTLGATSIVHPFKGKIKGEVSKPVIGKEDLGKLWEAATPTPTPIVEPITQPPITTEPVAIAPEQEKFVIRQPEVILPPGEKPFIPSAQEPIKQPKGFTPLVQPEKEEVILPTGEKPVTLEKPVSKPITEEVPTEKGIPVTLKPQEKFKEILTSEEAQKAIDDFTDILVEKYGEEEALKAPIHPEEYKKFILPVPKTKISESELRQLENLYNTRDAIEEKDFESWKSTILKESKLPEKEMLEILEFLGFKKGSFGIYRTAENLRNWTKDITYNLEAIYNHFAYSDIPYQGSYAKFRWGGTGEKPILEGSVFDEDLRSAKWDMKALRKTQEVYNAISKTQGIEPINLLNIAKGEKRKGLPTGEAAPVVSKATHTMPSGEVMPGAEHKEILQEAQVENIFKQIKAITTNVKIDQSFFDHFDRSELIPIQRKSPGLFSNIKGMPLDEVADGLGISTDALADKLRNAISKKQDIELLAKQLKEYIPPAEKVPVGDLGLKVGDKFKIHGEQYTVKERNVEGKFLIEDGDKFIVDEFDKITMPDEGSLKKGKYVQPKLLEGEKADIVPKMETEIQGQKKLALAFKPEGGFRREPSKPQTQQELTKRSDIAKFIQKKFDIPVRIGRFGGGALGIFKPKPEVIRTKFAHDIETISHEVGHALQKFLWGNISARPFKAFEDELIPIATKPKSGQPKSTEGFAEFIRLYSTNNEKALEKAPKFYKYFDELLKEKSPEAREILLETRDRFEKYLTQTPEQRKLSQISINDKGDKKGITLQDIVTKFIDELTPLKNIVNEITQGEDIPVIKDPYKLARMMPGVWGKADSFLEYKPFDYNTYKFSGKSLKEILSQIPKDRIDLYRSYQISKSEYESYQNSLKEGGRPFIADPISIQDAKYIIDKYASEFETIFQENTAYRDNLLRYFRDSGMLSGDTYKKFKELYKNYVPLYRVMETEKGMGSGKGLEAYQPIRTRRGSWRDFVDPIESDIKNTYLFTSLAEKNTVVNALVDLSNSKAGMGKYVEKIPFPTKKVIIKTEEILSQLSSDPLFSEIIKEFPDIAKVVSIFRKSAFTPKENVISGWKNGEQNLYQVHPDIARTIQSLDIEEINTVIKLLNYPTRWLRAGAVLSPEFLGRNPIRDQFTAFVYSEYGYIPGVDLFRGIYDIANKSKDYWKFKISGAEHSMFVSLDRTTLQKTVDNILSNKSLFHDTFKSAITNPIELLRVLSEFGEMGTRIGEFKKGLQKEGETKAGLLESGFSSRELSIDFAKKGSLGKVINMVVAFWNASVQGGVKMYEQHKEEYMAFPKPPKGHRIPLPTTMKSIAAITIPSIVLAIINYDDDKIKEVPQWQKDLFWLIRIGDTIIRIPKPFELGIIYGTLPERIVNYILSKDTRAFDKFIQAFARGALPSAVPTALLPIMENWANKSYFLDRPIVPASREKVQPEYQYQPYTTEVAKIAGKIVSKFPFIGETSAASPAKIENLVQGWTGGLGKHVLNTLDYGLRKTGIVQGKVRPTATLSDIPLIKGFVVRYPSSSTESIQTFYDNYGKATQTVSTIRSLAKEFQLEEARKLLLGNLLKLNQHHTALNKLSEAIQMIYNNPQIIPDEKRRLIDSYYLQMIAIARNGNSIYEKARKR